MSKLEMRSTLTNFLINSARKKSRFGLIREGQKFWVRPFPNYCILATVMIRTVVNTIEIH